MPYDPKRHRRRSIRLQGYDYTSPGAYFVTICTQDKVCLFGDIMDGGMRLNEYGEMVHAVWHGLPRHYPHTLLDAFVVMPNHVHGIVVITADEHGTTAGDATETDGNGTTAVGAGFPAPTGPSIMATSQTKRHGLPEIVRGFKTYSARRINAVRGMTGTPVWQRNYWERIIRTRREWRNVRRHIAENPVRWHRDRNQGD